MLSVVVPVYGCEAALDELVQRLFAVSETLGVSMEVILVNDASPDCSWSCIDRLSANDPRVKGINLSRNFGQHCAISAGLQFVTGTWVVVMDCDLQDVPEEIPKMYHAALKGHDAVFGRRYNRQDTWWKRFKSLQFYRMLSFLAGAKLDPAVANYSVVSGRVVADICRMVERHRTYGLLVSLATSRIAYVDIEHGPRKHGESSYTLIKQLRHAADVVISHSNHPLYMSAYSGFVIAALGLLEIIYLVIRAFMHNIPVAGWASTIASIWMVGGLLMTNLSIIGLYLGKVLEQVKGRPLFLVAETRNCSLAPERIRRDRES